MSVRLRLRPHAHQQLSALLHELHILVDAHHLAVVLDGDVLLADWLDEPDLDRQCM